MFLPFNFNSVEGVIDISSGEDDDDVVMVSGEEEDEGEMSEEDLAEAEDVNNSGSHINDMYNVADDQGRVLVNVGHPTADPDIYLSPLVAKHIKPHQVGGLFIKESLSCFSALLLKNLNSGSNMITLLKVYLQSM